MATLNAAIRAWEGRYANPLSDKELRELSKLAAVPAYGHSRVFATGRRDAYNSIADRLPHGREPITSADLEWIEAQMEHWDPKKVANEAAKTYAAGRAEGYKKSMERLAQNPWGPDLLSTGVGFGVGYGLADQFHAKKKNPINPASVKDQLANLIDIASDRAELARRRGDKGLANWYLGQAYAYQTLKSTDLLKRKSRKGGMPFLRKRNPGFVLNQLAKIRSTNEEVVIRAIDERKGLLTTANFYTVQRKDGSQVVLDDNQVTMLNPAIPHMTEIEQGWLEQWLVNQIHDSQRAVELFAAEVRQATGEKRQLLIDQKNFSEGQVAAYKQMAKRVGMKQRNPIFASLLSGVGLGAGVALGQKAVGWGVDKVSPQKQNVVQNPTWHEASASGAKIAGYIRSRIMAEGGMCSQCRRHVGSGGLARYEMQSGGTEWNAMNGQFCSDKCMGQYHR